VITATSSSTPELLNLQNLQRGQPSLHPKKRYKDNLKHNKHSSIFKNDSVTDYSAPTNVIVVIVNFILNATLMLIAIIGNSLVIAAIFRTPRLRSPSTTLLCSLPVSDFLVGVLDQPLYIAKEKTYNTLLGYI